MKSTSRALKTAAIGSCAITSKPIASVLVAKKARASRTHHCLPVPDLPGVCIAVMELVSL